MGPSPHKVPIHSFEVGISLDRIWGEHPIGCLARRWLGLLLMKTLDRYSLRIVHVDDDADFAEISHRWLKRAGFKQPITHCADGIKAIEYFSKLEADSAPHVIILDLHMPGVNGLEVLHWIRSAYHESDVAVYLLTSSRDPDHIHLAMLERVTRYLVKKPFFDELIECLDHLIASKNGPPSLETDQFGLDWLSGK
jgi:CheY-like chemotaxis protein